MELFRDYDLALYNWYAVELYAWRAERLSHNHDLTSLTWGAFIDNLDLGVKYISDAETPNHTKKMSNAYHIYEITDPQKWCLTCLRCGIV